MDIVHYLIYPIAGLLALFAVGGLNTKRPVVVLSSAASLMLNAYAIYEFIWWPIAVSLIVDFVLKAVTKTK
ncbi:hypothetical protein MUS1_08780 [Marinomonas ushuaiensis DSM 15871]|uniref:Uncharacterized protein n=1 Tax=Marinomonas ushuaiensis DSM 15871 TaxID=1122207 RepID=X7E087_9GAMM|nr:hypothetical protein [Marinomonas ushuaiensis]ETX09459.1 hypothetical protein MUS1_08780 [Marinomonas ushuaiensis DSM 15871]